MNIRSEYIAQITTQAKNFTNQVTMTTSHSGDMYPYEWLVHQCKLKLAADPKDAREYCVAAVEVLDTEDDESCRNNCIRFLQECPNIDFVGELLAVIKKHHEQLARQKNDVQGTIGSSLLGAAYSALVRNRFFNSVKADVDLDQLKQLLMQGNSPELVFVICGNDPDWMKANFDAYFTLYPEWANEIFSLLVRDLGVDPLQTSEKLLALHKGDSRRVEDLWKRIETFANSTAGLKSDKRFFDFIKQRGNAASKSAVAEIESKDAAASGEKNAEISSLRAKLFGESFSGYLEAVQSFNCKLADDELKALLLSGELIGRVFGIMNLEKWAQHRDYRDQITEFRKVLPSYLDLFSIPDLAPHLKGLGVFIEGLAGGIHDVGGFAYPSHTGYLISKIAADKIIEHFNRVGQAGDAEVFGNCAAWLQSISTAQFAGGNAIANIKQWDEPMLHALYDVVISSSPFIQSWILGSLSTVAANPLVKTQIFERYLSDLRTRKEQLAGNGKLGELFVVGETIAMVTSKMAQGELK